MRKKILLELPIIPLYRNDFVYVSNNQNSDNTFSTLTNFCAELLSNTNLINAVLEENKPLSTIFTNRSRDSKQIGIVAPMSLQNENDALFISVSSIQPIKESWFSYKNILLLSSYWLS